MVTISKVKKLKQRHFPWTTEPVTSERHLKQAVYLLCPMLYRELLQLFFESGFQL